MVDGDRLQQTRTAARTLADSIGSRQAGLIVYAGDAYLANTLTTDAEALGATIFALQSDTVPDRGNRPERALALARQTLRDAGIVAADIVLISAGAGYEDAAVQEAHRLHAQGYRLHAVQAAPARGNPESERRAALTAVAAIGGGATTTVHDLDGLAASLRTRPVERIGAGDYAVLIWQDLGRLVLVAAALFSLLLFRRSAT
jgi:Ca-activated chloride channel family protein